MSGRTLPLNQYRGGALIRSIDRRTQMARSKDFMDGWSMGWSAASEALLQSLDHLMVGASSALETVQPAMAANKPAPRRRGRPPKSSLVSAEPPRRRRGRPRKVA